MKALVLAAMMVAGPVGAEVLTYPQCIDMLQAMLGNQKALGEAFSSQLKAIPVNMPDAIEALRSAGAKAREEVNGSLNSYTDALADACESLRQK